MTAREKERDHGVIERRHNTSNEIKTILLILGFISTPTPFTCEF